MSAGFPDSKQRFSNRVADYVKFRPGYPPKVLQVLRRELGLLPEHRVADLGSGTGIFSEILLSNGNEVYAVEPNAEMREAAASSLAGNTRFRSVAGTAEATTLPDSSVDLVVSAQAFHWFDPVKTRAEALRILKKEGKAFLVWNERRTDFSPFLKDYDRMLDIHGVDYEAVKRLDQKQAEAVQTFFGKARFRVASASNHQDFEYAGLLGRTLSSSYVPKEGHPKHPGLLFALREIFDKHQRGGRVRMDYETKMYFGALN